MTMLIAFALASFVTAALLRDRPVALVVIAIALRVAVPSVASSALVGSTGGITPATVFLGVTLGVLVLTRPGAFNRELGRHAGLYLTLVGVLSLTVVVTWHYRSSASLVSLANTLGAAVVLLVLIRVAIDRSPAAARRFSLSIVCIAAAQALLASAQWATGDVLIWSQYLSGYYWYGGQTTRVMGTAGSWIDLGVLLAVAVPLAGAIRSLLLRFSTVTLLVVGILLSQSRIPLLAAVVGILYLILRSDMRVGARFASAVGIGVGAWIITGTELVDGIAGRSFTGDLSSVARRQAFDFATEGLASQPWFGTGWGSSFEIRGTGVLLSSFENSYLMYAWDIGILTTLALVLALASQVVRALSRGPLLPGAVPATVMCTVLMAAYSGLATSSPASWLLLSLVALCLPRERAEEAPGAKVEGVTRELADDRGGLLVR